MLNRILEDTGLEIRGPYLYHLPDTRGEKASRISVLEAYEVLSVSPEEIPKLLLEKRRNGAYRILATYRMVQ